MALVVFQSLTCIPGLPGAYKRLTVSKEPTRPGSDTGHVKGLHIRGNRLLVQTPEGLFVMPTDAGVITGWIY